MQTWKETSKKKICRIANLFLLGMLSTTSAWAGDNSLSEQILSSLELDKSKTFERHGEFNDVIKALKRSNYIHRNRDAKRDYFAIWKLLKPIDLFGNRIIVISNEEPGAFIGCCMNDRTEIVMEAIGDVGRLREFAKDNSCDLAYDEKEDQDTLKRVLALLKLKSSTTSLAQLSCAAPNS